VRHIRLEGTNYPICEAPLGEVKIDTPKGTIVKHEIALLVDAAWQSDCDVCRAPLIKHIAVLVKVKGKRTKLGSACGQENKQPYVLVARESDCNNCRAALLIAPVQEKGMGLQQPPTWEPQPMVDADQIIADVERNRDGR
jgi:hypothetical protein